MNSDLQNILSSNSTVEAIGALLDEQDAASQQLASELKDAQSQVSDLTNQIAQDNVVLLAKNVSIGALNAQLSALNAQLSAVNAQLSTAPLLTLSGITAYTQLHKWPARITDNKEQLGWWIDSGGHTAQTNPGTNSTPHGTFTWAAGSDNAPARMDFTPGAGWDNVFIYERFPLPQSLPTFVIDRRTFSLNAADRAAINAVEWQQEFKWNGKTYNLGWQWNFSSKLFRIFDFNNKGWKPTNVPFVDLGATPVSIMTKHQLDGANGNTTHLSITVNGIEYPVNVTQAATPTTIGNKYTVSLLQLDSDKQGDSFGINIHDAAALYV